MALWASRSAAFRSPALHAPWFDTIRAAEIVGLSRSTLNTLRSRGGGPPFLKVRKKVVYRVADLREWRDRGLVAHTGVTPENGRES